MQTPCWNDFRPLLWPGVLGLGTADRRARTAPMPKQLPVSVLCLPYAPSLAVHRRSTNASRQALCWFLRDCSTCLMSLTLMLLHFFTAIFKLATYPQSLDPSTTDWSGLKLGRNLRLPSQQLRKTALQFAPHFRRHAVLEHRKKT